MSGALEIRENQNEFDDKQLAALNQLGLDEVDEGNLLIFLHICQKRGLDPFLRQIYLIGRTTRDRGTVYTIQTGIDGFRLISERSKKYRGMTPTQWCGDDGIWRDVWLGGPNHPPAAARVGIIHADYEVPIYATAVFDSYCPRRNGEPVNLWKTMPEVMIAKCAEALARRQAFPEDLSGLYTDDEMAQADALEESGKTSTESKRDKPGLTKGAAPTVYTDDEMAEIRVALAEIDNAADPDRLKAIYDAFPTGLRNVESGGETVLDATKRRLSELRGETSTPPVETDAVAETLPLA